MAVSSKTRKCQMGRESTATPGTATAATTIWLGTVGMQDTSEVVFIEESIGNYGGYGRTYIASEGAAIAFESIPASYQQLHHPLESGIQTGITSTDGATWTYTYRMSSTAAHEVMTYTLEVGDNEDVQEAEYSFCTDFNLSGSFDEAVTITSNWVGRQTTDTSFTGSLSRPTAEIIIFNTGKLYIDATSGSVGATQVSNSFRSFSLDVQTGVSAIQTAEGNLYFTFHKITDPGAVLTITAEHTSDWDSAGERANWLAQTIRLIRLEFSGTAPLRLRVDMAGKWESFSSIEESDGNSILTGVFRSFYSTADTLFTEFEIETTLTAIP